MMSDNQPNQSTQKPKEAKPMSQADSYREYVDVIRPPDAPRGNINEIQLLVQTARIWWMRTKNPLAAALADGYWETMTEVVEGRHKSVETLATKLKRYPDDDECRMAFGNIIGRVVVHPTANGEPYDISLPLCSAFRYYGRRRPLPGPAHN